MNARIPKVIMDRLFILDSGKSSETTAEMVAKVGAFYNDQPKKAESIMNEIEKVTKRMVISVMKEDTNMFTQAVEENQKLLDSLGVVSAKAKNLLASLTTFGVGKVTGGGGIKLGSGNLLFIAKDPDQANKEFTRKNINMIKFVQDFEGVRLEKNL